MDSSRFERMARIPVLLLLYALALSGFFGSLWLAGAVIKSGLCAIFNVGCPSWY